MYKFERIALMIVTVAAFSLTCWQLTFAGTTNASAAAPASIVAHK